MGKRGLLATASVLAVLIVLAWWRSQGTDSDSVAGPSGQLDPARQQLQTFWRAYDQATEKRIQGDWAAAIRHYEEALRLRPEHEESLYYSGNCHFELGEYAQAADLYRRLVEINPSSNRGQSQLGTVLSSPWPGAPLDLEEAQQAFERCIELYPEESGAFVRLGQAALARGHLEEAQQAFDHAAGFRSPEGLFWAGYVRFVRQEYGQAAELFQRVLEAERREGRISGRGAVSEGDREVGAASGEGAKAEPAPGVRGPAHLQSAALRSRFFLYWCSRRLGGYPQGTPLNFRIQPPHAELSVRDITSAAGLERRRLGRGAWSDFDGDGDPDLALADPKSGLRIYRNQSGKLQELTAPAVGSAWDLAWGDYDRDGDPDLYLAASGYTGLGTNRLLRNRSHLGTVTFDDATPSSGLGGERATARVLFLDVDSDGWPEIVEAGNLHGTFPALRLFCNQSGTGFRECSRQAGIQFEGSGVDLAASDFNGDSHPDFLVLRWKHPLILYRNRGDGRFEDATREAGLEGVGGDGFSALFFDADSDGRPDLLVTRHASYDKALQSLLAGGKAEGSSFRLFRNLDGSQFQEMRDQAGLFSAHGVMQVSAADLNGDGQMDLVVANGSPESHRLEPALLFFNRQGRFSVSGHLPALDRPVNASGAACADFDGDGRPEVYLAGAGLFQLR